MCFVSSRPLKHPLKNTRSRHSRPLPARSRITHNPRLCNCGVNYKGDWCVSGWSASLTASRIWLRTATWSSCSGRSLCAARPLPVVARRFLAPGRWSGQRSGSLSDAGRHESASPPRCSYSSATSISHSAEKRKHLVTEAGKICCKFTFYVVTSTKTYCKWLLS